MKKKILIPLFAIAGVSFAAWQYHHEGNGHSSDLTFYGNVDNRQVELAFKGSDRIEALYAKEGDFVKKGDLLAKLDTEKLQAALALRQSQYDAQQEIVRRLETGSRKEEIEEARAQFEAAQIDSKNALKNYFRLKDLAARHFVSLQQADNAKAAADAADAKSRALQETLKLAVKGPRKEDIASAKAALEADRAQLSLARIDLEDARLLSPSDGIVEDRILEPGDMASPQKPVYTIALTDPVWARIYVPEADLGRIKPGMRAEISTDGNRHYHGWVGYISPSAEFTPKSVESPELRTSLSYQVRVFVCNPQNELRLGMPITVDLKPGKAEPCK